MNASTQGLSSTNNSNVSSQQYSVLLTTVNDLRSDLEKALSRLAALDEQNQLLTNNYNAVHSELLETRRKYVEAKESYIKTASQKAENEKRHEEFILQIKSQLIAKTKEFEAQKELRKPQDIDSIRMKIQEELEMTHKQQIQKVLFEMEQYKDMYFATKHDLDLNKTEFEAISMTQVRQINALKSEKEAIEIQMTERLRRFQENQFSLEKDELLQAQSIKIHELNSVIELMKEETRRIHQNREEAVADKELSESRLVEAKASGNARIVAAETDRLAAIERLRHATTDIDRKDNHIKSLKNQVDDLVEKLQEQDKLLEDEKNQREIETREFQKEIENNREIFDREVSLLRQQVEAMTTRLQDREELLRRLQRQSNEMQQRSESIERELRRAHAKQTQELNKRYLNVEVELASVKKEFVSSVSQANVFAEQSKIDLDNQKSEISRLVFYNRNSSIMITLRRLKREKEVLHQRLSEMDRKLSHLSSLESSLSEAKVREAKQQRELTTSRTHTRDLERSLESITLKYDHLVRDHESYVENIQAEVKQRIASLQASYKLRVDELKEKLKDAVAGKNKSKDSLEREKKRADLYKEKALQAHRQNKIISGLVENDDITSGEE